jgi:hypothetical protein
MPGGVGGGEPRGFPLSRLNLEDLRESENIIIIAGGHTHEFAAFNYIDGVISVIDFGASQETDDELYAWGFKWFWSGKIPHEKYFPMIDKEGLEIARKIKKECRNDVRVFYWPISAKSPIEI